MSHRNDEKEGSHLPPRRYGDARAPVRGGAWGRGLSAMSLNVSYKTHVQPFNGRFVLERPTLALASPVSLDGDVRRRVTAQIKQKKKPDGKKVTFDHETNA